MGIGRFCTLILLPIILSAVALIFLSFPTTSGSISSPSGYKDIIIRRTAHGIPSIEAKTYKDAVYAQGFVDAQERLWAMDMRRRMATGSLSEIFGSKALPADKLFRNLSFKRYAEILFNELDPEARELLEAYAKGVNDGAQTLKALPLEYWITWTNFKEWTPIDTLAFSKTMSFFLTLDWNFEILQHNLEEKLYLELADNINAHRARNTLYNDTTIMDDDELKQAGLFEKYVEGKLNHIEGYKPDKTRDIASFKATKPTITSIPDQPEATQENIKIMEEELKTMKREYQVGSNAWVVHGNHTVTGKPLLANDPHLDINMPSYFMQYHIQIGNEYISGVSITGIPGIAIGKTKHVAWGWTTSCLDTSQLYNLSTQDNTYLYEGEYIPMKSFKETIKVKGEEPVEITVFETHHGVVLDYYVK